MLYNQGCSQRQAERANTPPPTSTPPPPPSSPLFVFLFFFFLLVRVVWHRRLFPFLSLLCSCLAFRSVSASVVPSPWSCRIIVMSSSYMQSASLCLWDVCLWFVDFFTFFFSGCWGLISLPQFSGLFPVWTLISSSLSCNWCLSGFSDWFFPPRGSVLWGVP